MATANESEQAVVMNMYSTKWSELRNQICSSTTLLSVQKKALLREIRIDLQCLDIDEEEQ